MLQQPLFVHTACDSGSVVIDIRSGSIPYPGGICHLSWLLHVLRHSETDKDLDPENLQNRGMNS
ncbi:hypothetical protein INR49_002606 [Caranx melampygus]|nr:hypothetical protein INR49_002606 [Caranx melampygus]